MQRIDRVVQQVLKKIIKNKHKNNFLTFKLSQYTSRGTRYNVGKHRKVLIAFLLSTEWKIHSYLRSFLDAEAEAT